MKFDNEYTAAYRRKNPLRVQRWKDQQAAKRLFLRGYISEEVKTAIVQKVRERAKFEQE